MCIDAIDSMLPDILRKLFVLVLILLMLTVSCISPEKQSCTLAPTTPTPANSTSSNNAAQSGSYTSNIFIRDNYAYFGVGGTFAIFDISDPSNPFKTGDVILPNPLDSVTLIDDYAFAGTLNVVDVSDPYNPTIVGCQQGEPLFLANAVLAQEYAFAPLQKDGSLHIYEINRTANTTELTKVTSYQSLIPAEFILLPRPEIIPSEPRTVRGVAIKGQYAYVLENSWNGEFYDAGQIQVLDISNPSKPKQVAVYKMPDKGSASRAFISNNYLFISSRGVSYSTLVLDISDPQMPKEIERLAGLEAVLAVDNMYAYSIHVVNGFSTIRVRDTANPSTIVADWTLADYGWAVGSGSKITIVEDYAYSLYSGALRIVDIADPLAPIETSVINVP